MTKLSTLQAMTPGELRAARARLMTTVKSLVRLDDTYRLRKETLRLNIMIGQQIVELGVPNTSDTAEKMSSRQEAVTKLQGLQRTVKRDRRAAMRSVAFVQAAIHLRRCLKLELEPDNGAKDDHESCPSYRVSEIDRRQHYQPNAYPSSMLHFGRPTQSPRQSA